MNKEEILEAFNFRHATKEFDPQKKISKEDIDFLLKIANLSPTSFGFEPYKMLIVQNQSIRDKMKEFSWGSKGQLDTASHYFIFLSATKKLFTQEYMDNFMKKVQKLPEDVVKMKGGFFNNFLENDFKIKSNREFEDWGAKQVYIILGNMMTSAAMMGIDSCAMEGFHMDKMNSFIGEELGVDNSLYTSAVMCGFGYRVKEPKAKTRRSITETLQWFN